ncbi:hypothetical protein ACFL2R_03195 [Patescibacteria group bacterium]
MGQKIRMRRVRVTCKAKGRKVISNWFHECNECTVVEDTILAVCDKCCIPEESEFFRCEYRDMRYFSMNR